MRGETFPDGLRRLRGTMPIRALAARAAVARGTIGDLETGRRRPTPDVARALDEALDAHGELIELVAADRAPDIVTQAASQASAVADAVAASGPLTEQGVEEWVWAVGRHGRATRYRAERDLLPDLLGDIADLRRLLTYRQPDRIRRHLLTAMAQMAGLTALILLRLGDPGAATWWRAGRGAAAQAENRSVLAWMYAQEAYDAYYRGDMVHAVELATRAQQLAGGLPCVGDALAAPLEARAHAILGDRAATSDAVARAERALERLPEEERTASAFGYSESQLRFHIGNALTHLRETRQAREHQARALELYAASEMTDRTLIALDSAMCDAFDGNLDAAAGAATAAVTGLPRAHRSALILGRAGEVADRVPGSQQMAVELREVLALPPGRESHGDPAGHR